MQIWLSISVTGKDAKRMRPFTSNQMLNNDWRWTGRWVSAWRQSAKKQFRQKFGTLKADGPVVFYAQPFFRDGRTQDTGACHPTVKAVVDGFVDAGFLVDDGPDQVAGIVLFPPTVKAGKDGLLIAAETKGSGATAPDWYKKAWLLSGEKTGGHYE